MQTGSYKATGLGQKLEGISLFALESRHFRWPRFVAGVAKRSIFLRLDATNPRESNFENPKRRSGRDASIFGAVPRDRRMALSLIS